MEGVNRLQVDGIRSPRLLYKVMVELLPNHKKSNFWWYENLDSSMIRLGVIGFKKTRVMYLLNLFEGRGEIEQCDLVCMELL